MDFLEDRTEQAKTWLEPSLYKQLQTLARKEGRSVSGQLRIILKDHLEEQTSEEAEA